MNKRDVKTLHMLVIGSAKQIEGKLPDHPAHPYGRIPIAHIYDVIKRVMGVPAKECRDSRFADIVEIIKFCRDNPDEPHCASALRRYIEPEPVDVTPTLDKFFEEDE